LSLPCLHINADETGKHLFLLSGQSNMKRFQHKQFFTPAMQAVYGEDNVIVIKNAQGGQPISKWYKAWTSGKGEKPEQAGQLYDSLIENIKEKTADINIKSVTFIWMQGESDAKAGNVDVYAKSFKGLLGQLEKDLKRKDINVIIGRLSDFGLKNRSSPEWGEMRRVQMKLAEKNPRACWVDTDDLNGERHSLHYVSPEGYRKLGERYVEAAKKLIQDNNK
jgi:hypothetical protein